MPSHGLQGLTIVGYSVMLTWVTSFAVWHLARQLCYTPWGRNSTGKKNKTPANGARLQNTYPVSQFKFERVLTVRTKLKSVLCKKSVVTENYSGIWIHTRPYCKLI